MMVLMRSVLASHNQELYAIAIRDTADIADRLGSRHIEALSSSDSHYQFWLTPSLRGGRRLNRPATKLVFALTAFLASQTPLLRGDVVITSRTPDGAPAALSDDRMRRLLASLHTLTRHAECTIDRRIRQATRADRRARDRAIDPAPWRQHFRAPAGE